MHKTRYNALQLKIELTPTGPLLIKSGQISANPSLPDMQFVRTYHAKDKEVIYIPGSSLKGVVRGFIEKALRTINDQTSWRWACATFPDKDKKDSCTDQLEKESDSATIYKKSCGACRTFGHTRLKGRLAFTDLLPTTEIKTETRYGVAISRLSHAVAQGPFEMEVAVDGTFSGQLVLENYELWQVGLLTMALQAMNQGVLQVGFGKNRGFGEVKIKVAEATVEEIQPVVDNELRGLVAFVKRDEDKNKDEKFRYGLDDIHKLTSLPSPNRSENLGFYLRRIYDANTWHKIAAHTLLTLEATHG